VQNTTVKNLPLLLSYLHDTGVLYYRQGYFNNQIILNQDWAIQAIYKVLNRESEYFEVLHYEKGKLDYELLCEIWATHTDQERALFIDFMLSAELAFESTYLSDTSKVSDKWKIENRTFIVPSCLSSEKPKDVQYWEQKNAAHLSKTAIEYRFLPKVFIQRFIIRASRFSTVSLLWQKGLLLKTTQGEALVEAFYDKEQQKITIIGTNDFMIKKIKEELAEIAEEGKLKSKAGRVESEAEKFGLLGLDSIFENTNQETMTNYEKVLQYLQHANYAGYFEEMDKVVPQSLQGKLSELRMQFISGDTNWKFNQQLEDFAKFVDKTLRQTKAPTPLQPSQEESVPTKKTILMLTANPAGTVKLNLKEEHSKIISKLQDYHDKFAPIIKEAVNSNEFKEQTEILKPTVLHFAGHGEKVTAELQELGLDEKTNGIILQNDDKNGYEILSTDAIDVLFEYFQSDKLPIDVVVLNACYSEEQAQTIAKYVPFVVGTTKAIQNTHAIAFSTGFYFKLAQDNLNVENAFKSGRTEAVMKGAKKADFVLFTNGQKSTI